MAHHMQACLVLKQFQYILNVTEYVNENYLRVKEKFLRTIDYLENINIGEPLSTDSTPRHKRDSGSPFDSRVTLQETEYLIQLLTKLAAWVSGYHADTPITIKAEPSIWPTAAFINIHEHPI